MMARRRETQLGKEIRRLRMQSGSSLHGLAARLGVSAPHLSDIEHEHRRPSERLLRKIAHQLRGEGATYESLRELITGIDPETRDWVATTPGVRSLLRKVRESGRSPSKILRVIEKDIRRKSVQKKSVARRAKRRAMRPPRISGEGAQP